MTISIEMFPVKLVLAQFKIKRNTLNTHKKFLLLLDFINCAIKCKVR